MLLVSFNMIVMLLAPFHMQTTVFVIEGPDSEPCKLSSLTFKMIFL